MVPKRQESLDSLSTVLTVLFLEQNCGTLPRLPRINTVRGNREKDIVYNTYRVHYHQTVKYTQHCMYNICMLPFNKTT